MIQEKAITGSENMAGDAASPEAALVQFYRAFNHGDLALMEANWEQSNDASMSNPLGGVKRGWASIREVYKKIFNGGAEVYVEFYDYSIHRAGVMFCAVGRERGYLQIADKRIELGIRTSRTYRMDCGSWHQIHHHGSIDNPQLLAAYQQAVLGS